MPKALSPPAAGLSVLVNEIFHNNKPWGSCCAVMRVKSADAQTSECMSNGIGQPLNTASDRTTD